jgi:hypothetical protein
MLVLEVEASVFASNRTPSTARNIDRIGRKPDDLVAWTA